MGQELRRKLHRDDRLAIRNGVLSFQEAEAMQAVESMAKGLDFLPIPKSLYPVAERMYLWETVVPKFPQ